MALTLPKLTLDKKQAPAIVGGVVVLAAAAWFGWQHFAENAAPPPPARKPQAVTAAKPPAPAKAAAPADTGQARDQLIADVLAASGLKQELNQLPQRLAAGMSLSGGQHTNVSPAMARAIDDAVAKSFTAEGFYGRVSADLTNNFDRPRLQALLKDFSTPAAKSMIALQQASSSPAELAQFAHSAAATRPSFVRAGLIKRIDAATRASDLAVDAAFVSLKALALGIAGDNAPKAAAIDKTIEQHRAATTNQIRNATMLNLAFSFRDASDADLEKYAGICETESSKWFYGRVYESLLGEVKSASIEAGKRIGELPAKPAAAAAAKPAGAKARGDARTCLGLASNSAIIKCAEAYR